MVRFPRRVLLSRFTYSHDSAGRQLRLLNSHSESTSYAFDAAGRTVAKRTSNGARTNFTFSAAGWTTGVHHLSSINVMLSDFDDAYDNVGKRTRWIGKVFSFFPYCPG